MGAGPGYARPSQDSPAEMLKHLRFLEAFTCRHMRQLLSEVQQWQWTDLLDYFDTTMNIIRAEQGLGPDDQAADVSWV